jgi:NADPH:quinone reductase-like Zn-dependent oxidoreductase
MMGRAVWYQTAGQVALRPEALPPLVPGLALVRTLFSGISRGTERLVLAGRVPPNQFAQMRAPWQQGDFPFPVKYGYCAVGVVQDGPDDLIGRTVFSLHPHQDRFILPASALTVVPDGVPPRRATLAANMETALNALWDSGAGPADRIAVIGGGVVGLLVAYLAAGLPGAQVVLCDTDPERASLAAALGVDFTEPSGLPADCDVVFHASASAAGLAAAIGCAGQEARVMELSWYGEGVVAAPLGGAFHSRRLSLVASQVGMVAASRRARWSHARRLAAALDLLRDDRLDALVTGTLDLADVPRLLPALLGVGALGVGALGLPPVIRYPDAPNPDAADVCC